MKIGILANTAPRALLGHMTNAVLGTPSDIEGIVVDHIDMEVPEGIPVVNTCIGARVLEHDDKVRAAFDEEAELSDGTPDAFLYGFVSPTGVSDLMEMTVCNRLMVGGVGPRCGLVQGTALSCSPEVYQAFPQLAGIFDMLHQIQYCGEISIGITRTFEICTINFGHCLGGFALFTEMAKQRPQLTYEFAFGKHDRCELYDERISITTLMSYPNYPYDNSVPFQVMGPNQAERHMYRTTSGACELAYAAASGEQLFEARRRIRRTLQNCRSYNDDLQYRTDAGKFQKFVFNVDKYKEKGGHV